MSQGLNLSRFVDGFGTPTQVRSNSNISMMCRHAFLPAPSAPFRGYGRARRWHAAGAAHSWRASAGICGRWVRLSVVPLLWAARSLCSSGLLLPATRGVCAAGGLCCCTTGPLPRRPLCLPVESAWADRNCLFLPYQHRAGKRPNWLIGARMRAFMVLWCARRSAKAFQALA